MSVGIKELEQMPVKDHVSDQFKTVTEFAAAVPAIDAKFRELRKGTIVAISLSSNAPEWGDMGVAKTRVKLSEQMRPLECGVHYYAHVIE